MITGRGPGAPGMTPVAADLSEIRQAEEAIDRLAARAAVPSGMDGDPALALLTALAADVDAPGTGVRKQEGLPSRGLAGWLRAAVAGVVVAGLAGTTSLLAASMLARLTGGRARPRERGWGGRHARPRRWR